MEKQTTPQFMVIDDDALNNHICSKSIGLMFPGADIRCFIYPQEALDHILATYTGPRPSKTILFLDINMPVLNGWDVLYKFMKFPEIIKCQFTIYILSSSVSSEDKRKAKECSLVAGFIEKPLTVDILKTLF